MEQQEIFELIIKADEKLKYAHEDNAGLRRQQARDLLVRARAAATEILRWQAHRVLKTTTSSTV